MIQEFAVLRYWPIRRNLAKNSSWPTRVDSGRKLV